MSRVLNRRTVLAAGALLPCALLGASRARADFERAPDIVVYCDPTLAPALRAAGHLFRVGAGIPVRIFAQPGAQHLALIERGTRSDILASLASVLDDGAARGLIRPDTRIDPWHDPLVLAGLGASPARAPGTAPAPVSEATLAPLLGEGRLALTDATTAETLDGAAVIDALGLTGPLAGRTIPAATTQDAAFLVRTGAARLALVPLTDVRADLELAVAATVPAPAARYAAACSKTVAKAEARAFLAFLQTPEAADTLRAAGLEIAP